MKLILIENIDLMSTDEEEETNDKVPKSRSP